MSPLLATRRHAAVLFSSSLLALSVAGCGPQVFVIQQYDGPVRDSETIAILRINGADTTRVVTLDGELADPRIAEDARLHIEILPGRHALQLADAAAPEAGFFRVAFDAEAGRVYRAVVARPAAKVVEVDRSSDQVLRDATAQFAQPPPVPDNNTGIPRGLTPVIPPEFAPAPPPSPAPAPAPVEPTAAPPEAAPAPSAAPPEATPPPVDPTTPPQP